jgi:hypothetical protein
MRVRTASTTARSAKASVVHAYEKIALLSSRFGRGAPKGTQAYLHPGARRFDGIVCGADRSG